MSSVQTPPGKVTLSRPAKGSFSVAARGVQLPVRLVEVKERKERRPDVLLMASWRSRNETHLHALRQYERLYNDHRPHRTLKGAAPLRPLPAPVLQPDTLAHLHRSGNSYCDWPGKARGGHRRIQGEPTRPEAPDRRIHRMEHPDSRRHLSSPTSHRSNLAQVPLERSLRFLLRDRDGRPPGRTRTAG